MSFQILKVLKECIKNIYKSITGNFTIKIVIFVPSQNYYVHHTKIIYFYENIILSLLIFNDDRTAHLWIYPNGQCINSLNHKNILCKYIISMFFEISDL